ncbi:NAD(P)-dependent oxidoreductase [Streptomyces sp. NBC_00237]|uniref:NAD-dependent epimerase/dehydratase family protein n=1 Tax=Streptomyces sp. NBC_00237 TaxID=2975687 RepID=UPI0022527D24|nr:NAD(P)-dependent oxidoreductase [Streptomyces sp. NBC_00237]MCX5202002.1 NAD(P)-dependent oxidoreductase [Streptomyces sp. NBC_00237]
MPAASRTLLLTGAAGGIGTLMRGLLPAYGYALRLFDATPIEGEPTAVTADLGDKHALREAVEGVDAIVHLAGISLEAPFEKILRSNIEGTYNLYEAAREEGVRRIVHASSSHAIGFAPLPRPGGAPLPVETPHRPDTFYGLSKAFGEDLAQLYWDRDGLETVSVRIGECAMEPSTVRTLALWLSPGDAARLFDAALTAPRVGHTVVFGSSDNTRLGWDLSSARALGYVPQDDSEQYAQKLLAEHGEPTPGDPEHDFLGGVFCTDPPQWPY